MLKDKDIANTFKAMRKLIDVWYVGSLPERRGAEADFLMQSLYELKQKICYNHDTVVDAFNHALKDYHKNDRIIVFGSFHTVAAVMLRSK